MIHKFISFESCTNQKLCINVQHKYRKDVILAAIFCFAKGEGRQIWNVIRQFQLVLTHVLNKVYIYSVQY